MAVKQIETLVDDLYHVLEYGTDKETVSEIAARFGKEMERMAANRLIREPREPTLRMSNMGTPCSRKLWYSMNMPDKAEPLQPYVYNKFLYGDMIEEWILFLAEVSGHKVEGRQTELEINGIKGHRDAVIDGVLVDVKSASTFSFAKFRDGLKLEDDSFGYITQLQSYLYASSSDPIVTEKDKAAFLVVDKTLGHITLDIHKKIDWDWPKLYQERMDMVAKDAPPPRAYTDVPEGKSGNQRLGTECSYCAFKDTCWPGLRTFLSSRGPLYLTKVVREPMMKEAI